MIKLAVFDWAGTTIDYGCFAPIQGFIDGFQSIGVNITTEMARKPMGLMKLDHTKAIAAMLKTPLSEAEINKAYQVFQETLFQNIAGHCDVKEYVGECMAELRRRNIAIGSTTGYTKEMMEDVLENARRNGYAPDFCVASDEVPKGRPFPYMMWQNFLHFTIDNPKEAIKVGDTVADIKEGQSAGVWTVGIIMGSSEMGLTAKEAAALSPQELTEKKEAVRSVYYEAGADYIIDDLRELPAVIDEINYKLEQNTPHKLLTPGPLSTKKSVKEAMLIDHCTWDEKYKGIVRSVMQDITDIAGDDTYATVLLQGSGSYAVEAMLDSLHSPGHRPLLLVNGAYGRRMVTMAKKHHLPYTSLEFEETKPVDPGILDKTLATDKEITTVLMVHCETTTGIINPLEEIAAIAKKHNKTFMVDAMSSFAAYPIDMAALNIGALAASSNKCLEGLPGLSFVIAKKELLTASQTNATCHSLDLYDQYRELYEGGGKFRFTSPTNILLALRQSLEEYNKEGGLVKRQKRYEKNHKILIEGLKNLGIASIIDEEYQSYIITTFDLGNIDFPQLYRYLKEKGFIIYPGKVTDRDTFRLGNIGDVYPEDMQKLVKIIGTYLEENPQ